LRASEIMSRSASFFIRNAHRLHEAKQQHCHWSLEANLFKSALIDELHRMQQFYMERIADSLCSDPITALLQNSNVETTFE
jgi:hypothetical protein